MRFKADGWSDGRTRSYVKLMKRKVKKNRWASTPHRQNVCLHHYYTADGALWRMQIRIIIAQFADDIFKMTLTCDWLLAEEQNSRMIREISPVGRLEKSAVERMSCHVVVIEFGFTWHYLKTAWNGSTVGLFLNLLSSSACATNFPI